ncbi:flagella assembly protein FlgT middle domain-containing protein [Halioxenophilus aromaticivorans]|uniref:Lipoprotein n=1 Tax=Halioxenophilus aromaticivorans TaxID=1306992 RepID=A0AAV3TZV9_9ALTE
MFANKAIKPSRLGHLARITMISIALQGCAATGEFISDTIEQIRDLDYFLGNKELGENESPSATGAADTGFSTVGLESPAAGAGLTNLSRACLNIPDPRFNYRKKVAFLGFDIENPHQTVDLGAIHQELPRILGQRMDRDSFVVIDASGEKSPNAVAHAELDVPAYIRHIAQKHNTQFVIAGIINNAAHVGEPHSLMQKVKNIIPGQPAKKNRALEMTLSVFDGATGAIIDESYYQGRAEDQWSMKGKNRVLTAQGKNDHFANLLDTYLNHQTSWLADTLTCLPMQASVTSVSGSAITFATGTEALILPGDTLKLLRRIQLRHTLDGTPHYRYEENGEVVITQVYPNGALARFNGGTPPYQVNQGDIVQAW